MNFNRCVWTATKIRSHGLNFIFPKELPLFHTLQTHFPHAGRILMPSRQYTPARDGGRCETLKTGLAANFCRRPWRAILLPAFQDSTFFSTTITGTPTKIHGFPAGKNWACTRRTDSPLSTWSSGWQTRTGHLSNCPRLRAEEWLGANL